ncbi:DUF2252 domain-containing protein [Cupriavidus necator H16]|uniref:DUF2252 domain-containing protein n=2 Tax=Cupriavidus necator TaxID=106590 RepID=A0AAE5ZDV7_CUPNH|nr:DUF2252 domain-containing protein [Cupriavidus necator H16]
MEGTPLLYTPVRDMKLSAVIENWDTACSGNTAGCAHTHSSVRIARSGNAATIAGYMGSGQTSDGAIREFATEYCSQGKAAECIWYLVCDASMGQCACDLRFKIDGRYFARRKGGLS